MTAAHRVLIDVGGRAVCARLRVPDTAGRGRPIVLASGGAGAGTDGEWGPVEDRLVGLGPVLTYDRAGSGRSDGPPHATVAEMAAELDAVVDALDLREPAVVVGWSLGGFVAAGYALRYPTSVAGLVFVDPTPVEPPPSTPAVQLALAGAQVMVTAFGLASRAGVFSGWVGERAAELMGGSDPSPHATALALRLLRDPDALTGHATMMRLVPRYAAELGLALDGGGLPDVPTTVISAGERGSAPPDYATQIRASHEKLAARFPRGRIVTAPRATHALPYDDPAVVVDEVARVLTTAGPVRP